MKSKFVVMAMFLILMIWIGVKAGRWAEAQSQACEDSYQKAINTLRDR